MDTRQLNYFIAVAENLSFTEAAKQHYVAQSAISQQIKELEKLLGVALFIRNNRSVRLTPAGEALLEEAKAVIARVDEAVKKVQLAASGMVGHLKIGYILPMEKRILPGLIKDFTRTYPKVNLNLTRLDWGCLIDSLERDEIDLAFTFDLGLDNIPDIRKEILWRDTPAVAVPKDHPLAAKPAIKISALAHEPIIIFPRSTNPLWYDLIIQIFTKNGVSPRIVREHPRLETRLMLVEAGIGVSIVTHIIEVCSSPNLRFIDIEDTNASIDLVTTWKETNQNPSVPLFLGSTIDAGVFENKMP